MTSNAGAREITTENRLGFSSTNTGLLPYEQIKENALNELIGAGKSWISNKVTSVYLGNLFTVSPKNVLQQVKSTAAGQVFNTVNAVDDYITVTQEQKKKKKVYVNH